jgi:uncharacterized protein YegP (UPF0339 family)
MAKDLKIVSYTDRAGRLRWRALAGNGKQLAKSPKGYTDMNSMVEALAEVLAVPRDADLYKDKLGEWRWRLCLPSDDETHCKIAAVTSEGYCNKQDCLNASNLFLDAQLV